MRGTILLKKKSGREEENEKKSILYNLEFSSWIYCVESLPASRWNYTSEAQAVYVYLFFIEFLESKLMVSL